MGLIGWIFLPLFPVVIWSVDLTAGGRGYCVIGEWDNQIYHLICWRIKNNAVFLVSHLNDEPFA